MDYIARKESAGEVFVIRPPEKLPIHRTESDPAVLRKVYEIGRKTAEAQIDKMKAFLSQG